MEPGEGRGPDEQRVAQPDGRVVEVGVRATNSGLDAGGVFFAVLVVAVVAFVIVCAASFATQCVPRLRFERMVAAQRASQDVAEQDVPATLSAAMAANPDVCAWVDVPGTNVSLPVVRDAEDDGRYIYGSYDGSGSTLGTTFIEYSASPYFIDPVTVLYGHAYEDVSDVMMGQLHRFEDKAFFDAHDEFHVHLSDRVLVYRIASACTVNAVNVTDYIEIGGAWLLQEYADFVVNPYGDGFTRDVGDLDMAHDRIVQFSTCTIPSTAEYRYFVTGVLVEERHL